ncbi:hypothetical protein [Herbiconiux liangxiaofengii]|uniref:hypothetical protein n=1 Tax=Herbiconiux liangxiaofengii TaxID=3342795 RepID=UPI0035B79EE0
MLATISGCTVWSGERFDMESLTALEADPNCTSPHRLDGDPDYYGSSAGLYCLPDEGLGIIVKVYDDPEATYKMIGDWAELIDESNQIVYSGHWFATGPAESLSEMFDGFEMAGPSSAAPPSRSMSPSEADLALCSSISYGVLTDALTGAEASELEPYFESYPGLDQAVEGIASEALQSGYRDYEGDDLLAAAFLTQWDDWIKQLCASQ